MPRRGDRPGLTPWARNTIMGVVPLVALVLFFVTKSWLWFLFVPVAGVLLYGPYGDGTGAGRRRDRP